MRPEATTADRRAGLIRTFALALAGAGVLHFVFSLVVWGFFYVGSYRNGWQGALTAAYGLVHLSPPVVLLGLFAWALVAIRRRRRSAVPLLVCCVVLSLGAFAVEVRGDPQLQRVWFEEDRACSSRQNFYCTWWWWRPQVR